MDRKAEGRGRETSKWLGAQSGFNSRALFLPPSTMSSKQKRVFRYLRPLLLTRAHRCYSFRNLQLERARERGSRIASLCCPFPTHRASLPDLWQPELSEGSHISHSRFQDVQRGEPAVTTRLKEAEKADLALRSFPSLPPVPPVKLATFPLYHDFVINEPKDLDRLFKMARKPLKIAAIK